MKVLALAAVLLLAGFTPEQISQIEATPIGGSLEVVEYDGCNWCSYGYIRTGPDTVRATGGVSCTLLACGAWGPEIRFKQPVPTQPGAEP